MKSKRRLLVIVAIAVLMAMVLNVSGVLALHELNLFELDRNATDEAGGGTDWATLYASGPGTARAFTGIINDVTAPGNQFTTGGSKDNNNINQWKWKPGDPLDKNDITDAYAVAYRLTAADIPAGDTDDHVGDLVVFFGLDRFANDGSAQVGFWFLQDPNFKPNASGGFDGTHVNGDTLIQSNFSQGGVISTVTIFQWLNGALVQQGTGSDCVPQSPVDELACGTANQGNTNSPWPYTPKSGSPNIFPQGSFFEGGVNVTRLIPAAGCFTSFMAETRSSTPFDAQLKDFTIGNFDVCTATAKVKKVTVPAGQEAGWTFTLTGPHTTPAAGESVTTTDANYVTFNSTLQSGTYTITETPKTGWDSDAGKLDGSGATPCTFTVTMPADDQKVFSCTFTNVARGAIQVHKTSSKGTGPNLAGATFSVTGPGGFSTTITTGVNGLACVDNLSQGSYNVQETGAPTGWKIDDTSVHAVTVDNLAKCSDSPYVGEALSFTDTPLSQIQVQFSSLGTLVGSPATHASIVCTTDPNSTTVAAVSENGAADPAFDDTNETFTNLSPGTYTCTVVVDP